MKTLLPALAIAALFAACGPGANENNAMNERIAKNIAASIRLNDEMFNKHNVAIIDSLIAPDYVEHNPDPNYPATREGLKRQIADFVAGFPDISIKLGTIVADSDNVCIYSTVMGTNTGAMMGMQPTGKKISVDGIDIFHFNKDGKMIEHWGMYEQVKMLKQLGLMPDISAKKDSTKTM